MRNRKTHRQIILPTFTGTGRGMNAAFTIGRLCDFEAGCKRMLSLKESNRMVMMLYFISFQDFFFTFDIL